MASRLDHPIPMGYILDEQYEQESSFSDSDGHWSENDAFSSENFWRSIPWPIDRSGASLFETYNQQYEAGPHNGVFDNVGLASSVPVPYGINFQDPVGFQTYHLQDGSQNSRLHTPSIDFSALPTNGHTSSLQPHDMRSDHGAYNTTPYQLMPRHPVAQTTQSNQQPFNVLLWQSQLNTFNSSVKTAQPRYNIQRANSTAGLHALQPKPPQSSPPQIPSPSPASHPRRPRRHSHSPTTSGSSSSSTTAQCQYCSVICRRESDLRRHVDEVHLRKRFYCSFIGCGASYPRETKMRAHLRAKHPGQSYVRGMGGGFEVALGN